MVHGSWEELLDEISISYDVDQHEHAEDEEVHPISKKHGIWCTMLRKIGVKNKRCKEVRIIQPEPFESEIEEKPEKKKKKKFFKIPKQLKALKKKKNSKSKEVYESFQNENDYTTPDETLDNVVPDIIPEKVRDSNECEQSSSSRMEQYSEGDDEEEETYKYIGKQVHIDVLPDTYDLLEESGYETTSNSPVLNGDPEFWSFEDLRDGEEEELTVRGRFQRGWKSERAKSVRRSLRRSTKQSWKGLQMSLRHQMSVPNAQTVFNAVSTKRR